MGKVIAALAFSLLAVGLGAGCGGEKSVERAEAKVVDLQEIYTAYNASRFDAHKKYGGKVVVVSATVRRTTEVDGKPRVFLANATGGAADCAFSADWADQVARLTEGQEATVKGKVRWGDREGVALEDCVLP
jgi:hypothetical protein